MADRVPLDFDPPVRQLRALLLGVTDEDLTAPDPVPRLDASATCSITSMGLSWAFAQAAKKLDRRARHLRPAAAALRGQSAAALAQPDAGADRGARHRLEGPGRLDRHRAGRRRDDAGRRDGRGRDERARHAQLGSGPGHRSGVRGRPAHPGGADRVPVPGSGRGHAGAVRRRAGRDRGRSRRCSSRRWRWPAGTRRWRRRAGAARKGFSCTIDCRRRGELHLLLALEGVLERLRDRELRDRAAAGAHRRCPGCPGRR